MYYWYLYTEIIKILLDWGVLGRKRVIILMTLFYLEILSFHIVYLPLE